MRQSFQDGGANRPPTAEQVAAYVAAIARQLKLMADTHRLTALGYLLDLVRVEAEEQAQSRPGGEAKAAASAGTQSSDTLPPP